MSFEVTETELFQHLTEIVRIQEKALANLEAINASLDSSTRDLYWGTKAQMKSVLSHARVYMGKRWGNAI